MDKDREEHSDWREHPRRHARDGALRESREGRRDGDLRPDHRRSGSWRDVVRAGVGLAPADVAADVEQNLADGSDHRKRTLRAVLGAAVVPQPAYERLPRSR